MRLWHRTDQKGKAGIEAQGFVQQDPPIGPAWDSAYRGVVWFGVSKEAVRQNAHARSGWWVSIEVPDETQEHMLDGDTRMPGIYALPIEYVNTLSRKYEAGD